MANEYDFIIEDDDHMWETFTSQDGAVYIGNKSGTGVNGAFLFKNVNIPQGTVVVSADIRFYIGSQGGGSGSLKYAVYGIDEDNTATFGSDPTGRTKTSAVDNRSTALTPNGTYFGIEVIDQMNEILARGGWVSGNRMGFILLNDSSPNDVYAFNANVGYETNSYLQVLTEARPDFTPSPTTEAAPASPTDGQDYGLKIAPDGVGVLSAPDGDLQFITTRPTLKAQFFGLTSVTASVLKQVAHTLGYQGAFLVYTKGNTYRFRLPRFLNGATDPVGGGVQGDARISTSNLEILQNANGEAYYYIFIDEITT